MSKMENKEEKTVYYELYKKVERDCDSYKKIIDMLNDKIKELQKTPLLVEDGSADIEKLINDGFRVIVYRQGSTPPQWLKD